MSEQKCQYPRCGVSATTTYQDRARVVWHVCERHRQEAKRRKA